MFELQGLVTVEAKPEFVAKVLGRAIKSAQVEIEGFLPSSWKPAGTEPEASNYAFLLTLESLSQERSSAPFEFSLTVRIQGDDHGTSLVYVLQSEKNNQALNSQIFNLLATILETSLK